MIQGVHAMFYSSDPDATRAFLRDTLGFRWTDVGEGWLIFEAPEGDIGVHPPVPERNAAAGTHSISFYCDDIESTVRSLQEKGVEFLSGIVDAGFGLITHFRMPGDITVELYQPRYEKHFQS